LEDVEDDEEADGGGWGRTPGVGIGIPNGLKRFGRNDWFTIPGGYNEGKGIPKSKMISIY
jgi:hypothetical protein